MADTPKVYVLDEAKNAFEGMTKEQVITAIENMESTGSPGDIDAGFISKILDLNKKGKLRFWVGTQAEFRALESTEENVLYLLSDDPTIDDLGAKIDEVEENVDALSSSTASQIETINRRLDDLGFKEGVAGFVGEASPTVNSLTKQGRVVLLNLEWTGTATGVTIPEGFRPPASTSGAGPDFAIVYEHDNPLGSGTVVEVLHPSWNASRSQFSIGAATVLGGSVKIANVGWRI